jgi:hypothetical protein
MEVISSTSAIPSGDTPHPLDPPAYPSAISTAAAADFSRQIHAREAAQSPAKPAPQK